MKQRISSIGSWIWHHKVRTLILLLVIGGIVGYFLMNKGKKEEFEQYQVKKGTVQVALIASGKIKAKNSAQLMFSNPAKVTWVGVKKGDAVGKWQGLASVDRREMEKAIKQKLLLYNQARWDLEQSYDDNGVKGVPLAKVGLLSDKEKRIIEKYQFVMDSSVLDVEIATLALEEASLLSPISGVVVDDGGLMVGKQLTTQDLSTKSIRIVDLDSIYFQADVDESEYGSVKEGMDVSLTLDAFPEEKLTGKVVYIGKEGVKKTGGGIQIPVDIALQKVALPLVPEISGDAQMIVKEKQDVLVVDKSFARKTPAGYVVDTLKDGKKVEQKIDVGLVGVSTIEVTGGLSEGDVIVIPKKTTTVQEDTSHRRD